MKLQAREIAIDASLTSAKLEELCCHAGRYHLITDLARKGPIQITLFLDRINTLLAAAQAPTPHTTDTVPSAQARAEAVRLSLITVLAIDDSDMSSPAFPLFDFLGVKANSKDGGSDQAFGVMFSTYIHDLDRQAIENSDAYSQGFSHSRLLVDALFFPSKLNDNEPPFLGRFPIFAFPCGSITAMPAKMSPTDRYMRCLGFVKTLVHGPQGTALRIYTHQCDTGAKANLAMDPAILAVGQACAEMVEPNLYAQPDGSPMTGDHRPQPFDRWTFNASMKRQQQRTMQQWLARYEHLLDESPRECGQYAQTESPMISSS